MGSLFVCLCVQLVLSIEYDNTAYLQLCDNCQGNSSLWLYNKMCLILDNCDGVLFVNTRTKHNSEGYSSSLIKFY